MTDWPTLVAIDLGAESCRVSLLDHRRGQPTITMLRRIPHHPQEDGNGGLRWDLEYICNELESGLRACAAETSHPIVAIGVTGWAVDYVRLDASGQPLAQPFCYRDQRTNAAMDAVHSLIPPADLYAQTGTQLQPLNTIYQLYADQLRGSHSDAPWLNLPEYILHWLGAPRIAEYTNATHTGLVDATSRTWSDKVFFATSLNRNAAPLLVETGTLLGPVRDTIAMMPPFAHTQLVAPACHDTASAIAGLPIENEDRWAYLSSGTWSLMGVLMPRPILLPEACARGFTNLGSADQQIMFHRGIHGMWLLRQCLNQLDLQGTWSLSDLIRDAERLPAPDAFIDLDDPVFIGPGDMISRINRQRLRGGLNPLPSGCEAAPSYANLIFHSLAARYSSLLHDIAKLTGNPPERIYVVGGGSRNEYLNRLTERMTGIPVIRCAIESSTLGNFAILWARVEQPHRHLSLAMIAAKARILATAQIH